MIWILILSVRPSRNAFYLKTNRGEILFYFRFVWLSRLSLSYSLSLKFTKVILNGGKGEKGYVADATPCDVSAYEDFWWRGILLLSCSCIFCFLWHAYEGSAWKLDKVKNNLWVKGQSCNFVDSGGSFHCTAAFSFIYFPPFFLSSASTGELEKREKMGKKNKRRVPEVLWRLYRDRARSLSHTVTYLFTQTQLPPSNSNTSGAEDDMSFLLKHNDPTDYRNLLNNCYIVINDNARPLPSHFSLRNRWSQHQVTIMPGDNLCFFFYCFSSHCHCCVSRLSKRLSRW